MFNYLRKAGTTDVSVVIRIIDSTDGTPETGVVWNTSGIDLEYRREGATTQDITEATLAGLDSAHADGGFLHIGNGYYRLDLPDAACQAGATGVLVHGTVTGMVVIGCYVQLVTFDPFDSVRMGMTALPNAAAEASGGLYTRGTGAGQINQDANGRIDANVKAISEDTTAADNCEADYDGTGYAGGTIVKQADVTKWNGTAVHTPGTAGVPLVDIHDQATALIDAIWDEVMSGHSGAGSAGKLITDNLNAPIATVDTVVDGIATTLGSAGAGLTGIPWNAAWDAEVQSECTDALNAYDPPTKAELDTAQGAVTVAAIGNDVITAASIAAGAGTEIAAAVWDHTGSLTSTALELLLERIYYMLNQKMIVTESTGGVQIRNDADGADLATGNVQDLGATTVRAKLTWS